MGCGLGITTVIQSSHPISIVDFSRMLKCRLLLYSQDNQDPSLVRLGKISDKIVSALEALLTLWKREKCVCIREVS